MNTKEHYQDSFNAHVKAIKATLKEKHPDRSQKYTRQVDLTPLFGRSFVETIFKDIPTINGYAVVEDFVRYALLEHRSKNA